MSSEMIHAPFTDEQVQRLNEFQQRGDVHPFTCGNTHDEPSVLIALNDGWHCWTCGYTQTWAHAFMASKWK
jgi:hypothetical protein